MRQEKATLPQNLRRQVSGTNAPPWWGMIILIITEATLFALLLGSYYNLRFHNVIWPPDGIPEPDLLLPGINTAILLGSSLPMWWADSGIKKGKQGRLRIGLAAAFVMGATFLTIQIYGVSMLSFNWGTSVYGSLFYTITGLHGLHLLVALIINGSMQILAWLGYFTAQRYLAVQMTALYWHFVDAVWIFVFFTLHLSPYIV